MQHTINTDILDNLIVGRVDPQIYAFETNTIPNYLKVGDTYRPLQLRINEWRSKPGYEKLQLVYNRSARINDDTIFRDYSVHTFLLNEKHCVRLLPEDITDDIYYSKEFFRGAKDTDVDEAIEDIIANVNNPNSSYEYYTDEHLPKKISFERTATFSPRPNQNAAIEEFVKAVSNGRKNLLMYAVMRFGKSFTAMCCAKAMNELEGERCKFVVIVSGKGDVRMEWQKTVESHVSFANFEFLDKEKLDNNPHAVTEAFSKGKQVALFLTLQDLSGTDNEGNIKKRHAEVFSENIDLLIIDETHYGARGDVYGQVLKDAKVTKQQQKKELEGYDESAEDLEECIKALTFNVKLHLSGTPYRILMGNEFDCEDIVSFCQFTDIVDAQKQWDEENDKLPEDEREEEWNNPYFGFPQMIRFAFNPTESARAQLRRLKASGATYAFSELFRPKAMTKQSDGSHKQFDDEHRDAILDIFRAIDGSEEDKNILPFLDYDKIQEGKMCRHIVCVLPFRTSCDAMEELLNTNDFLHLNEYKILNVAGYESQYDDIKTFLPAISKCEEQGQKTITLTVNKLLTGSTVEFWDTMLYFKDTSSPQEYDQAIFRLQNQYVTEYVKNGKTVRINMKPQTLLVDFDPDRMFELQEQKALYNNINKELRGNDELCRQIYKELTISPIVYINQGNIELVTPSKIIDAVSNYHRDKSIMDEAWDIPFDKSWLEIDELKGTLATLKPLGGQKGLEMPPYEGDGTSLDVPPANSKQADKPNATPPSTEDIENLIEKQAATYRWLILLYAFLSHDSVCSLDDIIASIPRNDDNQRIAAHVGIDVSILKKIKDIGNEFITNSFNHTIHNINSLGKDTTISPIERAEVAMRKLSRISESEIVTPANVTADMVDMIPEDKVTEGMAVLDIASVQGEFAYAFHKKYHDIPDIKIYSVATSPLTYELTRKVYESLDLPVSWVLNFHSFALLGGRKEECIDKLNSIAPNIVFAAPPYNQTQKGGRKNSGNSSAIYQHFYNIIRNLKPDYFAMFLKSNWYSGGRGEGLAEFRDAMLTDKRVAVFHDHPDPKLYIKSNVTLRGGLCTFLWSKDYNDDCMVYNHINGETLVEKRPLKTTVVNALGETQDVDILLRFNKGIDILRKVLAHGDSMLNVMARNAFSFGSEHNELMVEEGVACRKKHKVYLPKDKVKYIAERDIPEYETNKDLVNSWKVIVAKASPGDDTLPHSVISTPIISEPGSLCTDSHLVIQRVENKQQAKNLAAYMKTRFFRFMMIMAKSNQNMHRDTFRFVPQLDINTSWTDSMLYDRYGITEEEQTYIAKLVNAPRQ